MHLEKAVHGASRARLYLVFLFLSHDHKFKEKFGCKAKMLSGDEVPALVGHPVGGVCPFGCREGIPVYLDESLRRFTTVFPAVGSPSSAIELTLDELWDCSGALEWVDVCRLPE